jgi:serine/threonine-protein kinase
MTPEQIGRYEIEKELGRGGMAVVYLARDPLVNRKVAIKVLPRQFTFDPQFRARFQREAQVIAALDHPAIVPVYDFGEQGDQPYIVMRYMNGGSLSDRLKQQGPFSVQEAADILLRIGSALDEAHQKGVVHRDLKPDNVLFDDRDDAFVSDFGIVKVSEATVQYTGNAIIGTPGYMSPEQARGDIQIDGRSDVYSLGAIAYEMLTGKLPYHSDTPMGMAMKHIMEPVPNVLDANPTLPPSSATVISKAMAKEPNQRYQKCTDIADDLALTTEQPLVAVPMPPLDATVIDVPSIAPKDLGVQPEVNPVVQPKPAQGLKRVPIWAWGIGCLGLVICGALTLGLGGYGVIQNFFGDSTVTSVANATLTPTDTPTIQQTPTIPPTATVAELPIDLTTYASESTGITFSYPKGWYIEEDFDFIAVASDPELIEADEIQDGAVALVIAGNEADFDGTNPTDRLNNAVDGLDLGDDTFITDGPNETFINGQQAAVAKLSYTSENGTDIVSIVALIASEDRAAFVLAATPANSQSEYRPIMEAIVQSVEVDEPATSEIWENVEGVLGAGESVGGVVVLGSSSVWNLVGHEGDIVEINAVPGGEDFDLILDILDQEGDSILDNGEVDESFGAEQIQGLRLPYTGDYYISIRGFENSAGDYELTIINSDAVAEDVEPGTFLFVSDTIENDGFSHVFPFYAISAGTMVTAYVEPLGELDVVLSIYNRETEELLEEVDDSFGDEILSFIVPFSSNYYFNLTGYDDSTGDYDITLFGPPSINFMLAPGDELVSQFDEATLIDYLYTTDQTETITILVEPDSDLDLVLEIIDRDSGNTLILIDDGLSGEPEELTFTFPAEGIYIIRVTEFYGETGAYYLTLN